MKWFKRRKNKIVYIANMLTMLILLVSTCVITFIENSIVGYCMFGLCAIGAAMLAILLVFAFKMKPEEFDDDTL